MSADLIIYGIVAAGLVLWLRNVLGTRHGEERQRPNPFMPAEETVLEGGSATAPDSAGHNRPLTPEEQVEAFARDAQPPFGIDNKTAEAGLIAIARADKGFDVRAFLNGAQDAFVMIVEAFAKGDRETLRDLLDDTVYAAFEQSIADREARGHTQRTDIHAIRKAEIIEAGLEGKTARITVRFIAEETGVVFDSSGAVIEGNSDTVTTMRDVWTFTREIRSRDPRWLVLETRGDEPGEHAH